MLPKLATLIRALLVQLGMVCILAMAAGADESWPEFRGPGAQGIAPTTSAPHIWSEQQNVTWKVATPGRGWSSPVIVGNRIWMTTAIESPISPEEAKKRIAKAEGPKSALKTSGPMSLRLLCFDRRDGHQLSDIELFHVEEPDPLHGLNSYASPTPVFEAGKIYCHFGTYGTACVDVDSGKILWSKRLPLVHIVGPGSSPIVYEQLLIIPCDGADAQYVIALDKATGETVWKKDRPPIDNPSGDQRKSFCTPLVIDAAGRKQMIVPGSQWFVSYDPLTGEELWRFNHGAGYSVVPRPVFDKGIVYLCNGFNKATLFALRVDGHGDVTKTHLAWKSDKQIPFKPSPLLADGLLYIISDNGVAACFGAEDGKVYWTKRLPGNYSSSPLMAAGNIYFFNHEGKTTVIKPGQHFQQVSVNSLEEGCMASAAALDGALYMRTDKHLYRIEDRAAARRD